ncbi:MAG: universal stress protein [Actinomycetota bacterium]
MFPTRMLLAMDGSRQSERAARMAVRLAGDLDSELHVVYVGHIPSAYAAPESMVLDPDFQERVREMAEKDAREDLEEQVNRVRELGGEVAGAHARVGRPDAEIVHLAEELGAGLIVLGSRGLGPLRRAVLGSVSNSVVRHAHGAVLVVRGDSRERDYLPGRILAAYDGSTEAEEAARAAVEISSATGSELHLVYALQTAAHMPYPHPLAAERSEALIEEAKHEARAFIDGAVDRMRSEGAGIADAHLVFGKPDDEIVKLSEELEAGMIVMGSRGLGGVRRALMGSVSDSVVKHAHCPVMVVRR